MKRVTDLKTITRPIALIGRNMLGKPGRGFSTDQLRKLARDVDPRHVHAREFDGRLLSYIEGWYAIAQANEIFGYAGWDREMVHFERVMERPSSASFTCAYMARVRIRVRAAGTEVVREGTGWGAASANSASAANERALKSAETDATKRALSTFGARFGLRLYDKDNPAKSRPSFTLFAPDGSTLADHLSPEGFSTGLRQLIELCRNLGEVAQLSRANAITIADLRTKMPHLLNAQNIHFADLLLRLFQRKRDQLSSATGSAGLTARRAASDEVGHGNYRYVGQSEQRRRQPILADDKLARDIDKLSARPGDPSGNLATRIAAEKADGALDKTAVGSEPEKAAAIGVEKKVSQEASLGTNGENASGLTPQSDILTPTEIQDYSKDAPKSPDAVPFVQQRIDKSKLLLPLERRLRDKAHLRRVAELPCLVCSRQPSHAHHLRYAQKRGMSQKVSDEYTVPLCGLHHGDLHRSRSEQDWWARQNIDPLPISSELWAKHHIG